MVRLGINDWPTPGRIVRRETYLEEYEEQTHRDGIPFVPGASGDATGGRFCEPLRDAVEGLERNRLAPRFRDDSHHRGDRRTVRRE